FLVLALYRRIIVLIQPIGFVDSSILERLALDLTSKFNFFKTYISDITLPLLDRAYNKRRMQYNSSLLLHYLSNISGAENYDRILGVVDVDIYADELNFVFGEAILNGRFALISLFRLRPEFYGYGVDLELLFERALKEAVHELGHTLGLTHCPDRRCVMHFSNSILDTDYKSYEFCSNCRFKILDVVLKPKV
ncbi:MAG: archaemetzincin family Zn-dependent metalloprotease, partial [Candidatus Methanomethylicia archaeon]